MRRYRIPKVPRPKKMKRGFKRWHYPKYEPLTAEEKEKRRLERKGKPRPSLRQKRIYSLLEKHDKLHGPMIARCLYFKDHDGRIEYNKDVYISMQKLRKKGIIDFIPAESKPETGLSSNYYREWIITEKGKELFELFIFTHHDYGRMYMQRFQETGELPNERY